MIRGTKALDSGQSPLQSDRPAYCSRITNNQLNFTLLLDQLSSGSFGMVCIKSWNAQERSNTFLHWACLGTFSCACPDAFACPAIVGGGFSVVKKIIFFKSCFQKPLKISQGASKHVFPLQCLKNDNFHDYMVMMMMIQIQIRSFMLMRNVWFLKNEKRIRDMMQ